MRGAPAEVEAPAFMAPPQTVSITLDGPAAVLARTHSLQSDSQAEAAGAVRTEEYRADRVQFRLELSGRSSKLSEAS
jgi:hypothetical protein